MPKKKYIYFLIKDNIMSIWMFYVIAKTFLIPILVCIRLILKVIPYTLKSQVRRINYT